jgi:NAD(P)-dependent dehydrogenase (short-subunit alcohol dehydrogenase family)
MTSKLVTSFNTKPTTMSKFENKVVIVTGCSSGIGLATSLLFLDRQARVFGIDISPFKHALSAAQEESFCFHQANLTESTAAQDSVAACTAKFGPKIDILVNCAGITDGWSSADTIQEAEWDRVLAVNLTAPVRLMTAVLQSMKEHQDGAIVNVCSKAGNSGATAGIAYTASKHGLVRLPLPTSCSASYAYHDRSGQPRMLPGDSVTTISAATQCFREVRRPCA